MTEAPHHFDSKAYISLLLRYEADSVTPHSPHEPSQPLSTEKPPETFINTNQFPHQKQPDQLEKLFPGHPQLPCDAGDNNQAIQEGKNPTAVRILEDIRQPRYQFSDNQDSKEVFFTGESQQKEVRKAKGPVFSLRSQCRSLSFDYILLNINIFNSLKQQYKEQAEKAKKYKLQDKRPEKLSFKWKSISVANTTNLSILKDFLLTSQWINQARSEVRLWASLISREEFQQMVKDQAKKDSKTLDNKHFILLDKLHSWYTIAHLMTKFDRLFFIAEVKHNNNFLLGEAAISCKLCNKSQLISCLCSKAYYCTLCTRIVEDKFHKNKCKYALHQQIKCEPMILKKKSRLGMVGLINPGNICFFNTALQCLLAVEPLTKYFLSKQYFRELNPGNHMGSFGQITCQYAAFVNQAICEQSDVLDPKGLRNCLARFCNELIDLEGGQTQQDSHECLALLLNYLREDLNMAPVKHHQYYEESSDGMIDEGGPKRFWQETFSRNSSIVDELFTIIIKSSIECSTCHVKSTRYEPSLYLPLPVLPPVKRQVPSETTGVYFVSNNLSQKNKYINMTLELYTLAQIEQQTRRQLGLKHQILAFYILSRHGSIDKITPGNVAYLLGTIQKNTRQLFCLEVNPEDVAASSFEVILTFQQQNQKLGVYENVAFKRPLFFSKFNRPSRGAQIYSKILMYLFKAVYQNPQGLQKQEYIQKYMKECPCPFKLLIANEFTNKEFVQIGLEDEIRMTFISTEIIARFDETADFKLRNLSITRRVANSSALKLKNQSTYVFENVSVLDCISKFSQLEVIAGWKCPKCQSTEGANKTQSIYQTSKVLIIYFKRFQSVFENGQLKQEKLNYHIDFPQILDLSSIIDVPQSLISNSTNEWSNKAEYRLKAVANHYEQQKRGTQCGHYVAYVQHKHTWIEFNDERPRAISNGDICTNNAYYLIYERIE